MYTDSTTNIQDQNRTLAAARGTDLHDAVARLLQQGSKALAHMTIRQAMAAISAHNFLEAYCLTVDPADVEHNIRDARGNIQRPDAIALTTDGDWVVIDWKFDGYKTRAALESEYRDKLQKYADAVMLDSGRQVKIAYIVAMPPDGRLQVIRIDCSREKGYGND